MRVADLLACVPHHAPSYLGFPSGCSLASSAAPSPSSSAGVLLGERAIRASTLSSKTKHTARNGNR